jgi:hypothetical protein
MKQQSIGIGTRVLYQPPPGHQPQQQAAIITGWDEVNQVANLLTFPDGQAYSVAQNGVKEGVEDGTFQQLGVLSRTAERQKREKDQQAEIFRKLSGVQ